LHDESGGPSATGIANCCTNYGQACVDDAATIAEIDALHRAGIGTFVVGIPGSGLFEIPRPVRGSRGQTNAKAPPSYYRVDAAAGVAGLTSVFTDITTQLVTACELDLEMPPIDPKQVNVAIDCNVVPSGGDGPMAGASITSGEPGEDLHGGHVVPLHAAAGAHRVDIVFGCPTVR